ncbi:MAG: DNA polymerase III subunit chi [Parachlamydiales bacterium]|nr:DNA polymerase III subunit chi [Parachlamydiales bacterium]
MSTFSPATRVIFFQVNENGNKLKKILETAQLHFVKKEPILFFVEEEKSEKFVDELLWKQPAASFLPHVASDGPTNDFVAITKSKNNVNQAKIAFNLCPTALLLNETFKIIYEFEDLTAPVKKNLSSQRFDAYKKAGFFIEAR